MLREMTVLWHTYDLPSCFFLLFSEDVEETAASNARCVRFFFFIFFFLCVCVLESVLRRKPANARRTLRSSTVVHKMQSTHLNGMK